MAKHFHLSSKQKAVSLLVATSLSLFLPLGNIANVKALSTNTTISSQQKVIVTFKNTTTTAGKGQVEGLGNVKHQYHNINAVSMNVTPAAEQTLKNNPNVQSVEPDITVKIKSTTENWGVPKVNAPSSWNSGLTGKGVKVGVIDTGIYPDSDLSIAGGVSVVSYTSSYTDDNGHGTAVAGVIGSKNNSAIVGVAPDVQLYAIKALDQTGSGNLSDIISGIDWAINNHMNIVNLSLGTSVYSQALEDEVNKAYNAGVLVVAAAGNESGAVDYPAKFSSAIAVSATDQNNQLASFSNYGPEVEVAAPGVNILSTYINNQYAYLSGTSLSTPFVTGDLALLKQEYPNDTATQLRSLLDQNVTDLGTAGKDNDFGYGLIQTPVNVQTVPTNFKTSNTTQTSTILSWEPVDGAISYQLFRNGTQIMDSNVTTYTDQNLSANTSYQYQLEAVDSNGTVIGSPAQLSVTTLASVPGAVQKFYASNVKSHSVVLNWYSAPNASYYIVKRNGTTIYTSHYHSFVDSHLNANTTYQYEVIGVNSAGNGQSTGLSVTTAKERLYAYDHLNFIYARGKTVYISVVTKDSLGKIVPNVSTTLAVTSPNGSVYRYTGTSNSSGNLTFQFATTKYSHIGFYDANLSVSKSGYDFNTARDLFFLK